LAFDGSREVQAERRTIRAAGVITSYLAAGGGSPVVLLHGMGANSGFWRHVIGGLAAHRLVLAPDIIGFGRSIPDPAIALPSFTRWLSSWLDTLGIDRSVIVGHSLGGAIAVRFTQENPARIDRLVLVGSIGFGTSALGLLAAGLFIIPSNPVSRFVLRRILSSRPGSLPVPPTAQRKRGRSFNRRLAVQIMKASGWKGVPSFPSESLSQITQPTLLLWGERDRVVPVSVARRLCAVLPHAELQTVSGCGHMPFIERPDVFTEKLLRFLESPPPA
jgi:pimeloyl-ACP methyl ester carboxylesterase